MPDPINQSAFIPRHGLKTPRYNMGGVAGSAFTSYVARAP